MGYLTQIEQSKDSCKWLRVASLLKQYTYFIRLFEIVQTSSGGCCSKVVWLMGAEAERG